jgi:hypothetical protein
MRDDAIINRVNKFFETHHLTLESMEGFNDSVDVKIEITGEREYITVGNWENYYTYTIYLKPEDENSKQILKYTLGDESEIEVKTYDRTSWVNGLARRVEKYMSNICDYFGVDSNLMLTKIVHIKDDESINESILTEGRYDGITRTIIKDIIKVFKQNKTGEFSLPEDLDGSGEMTYYFGRNLPPFSVTLTMNQDENVDDFEVDGEYYRDDETIVIEITSNPKTNTSIMQKLIGELNETVRHELEHVKQNMLGYKRKKEPKTPFKYYTQKSELEAQIAGFKRRARKEKKDIRDIANDWFNKYQKRHNLTPQEVDKLKKKLFSDLV